MTSNAAMNIMMGWMKGLASWVLGLFNLSGSGGFSPLGWLSDNWLKLLVFFLVVGVAMDVVVWLMRWRPYWVWFNKKRIVINDDNFFAGEELVDTGLYDPKLFSDPELDARKRAPARDQPSTIVRPEHTTRKLPALVVREDADELSPRRPGHEKPRAASPTRARPGAKRTTFASGQKPARARRQSHDPLFSVDPASAINPETGEDAVFNVSDLPVSKDELEFRHKRH